MAANKPTKVVMTERPEEMKLTASTLPSTALAFSNCCYVSNATYEQLLARQRLLNLQPTDGYCNCELIEQDFVVAVRPNVSIPEEQIGFSGMQRQRANVNTGQTIRVRPFDISEEEELNIVYIQVELKSKRPISLKEDDMVLTVQEFLTGFVVYKDQDIPFERFNCTMLLHMEKLEQATNETTSLSKAVRRGLITDGTLFHIFPKQNNFLDWVPTQNATRKNLFKPTYSFQEMGIGGLDDEFDYIFRRAFASRLYPPGTMEKLGIPHVKGILLYGPPGTGKTLIARQIGKILDGHEPKVVNGPEVLNKFVGQSEENIRALFIDAEKEYKEKGDNSQIHIIIFDEIDAICKQRGSDRSGTGVHDTVVNQLLSKLDGVDQLNNILVIGMTNRKDLIDPALLRPGRLELHIPIGLPDEKGRLQIFEIHTKKMKENKYLDSDVDLPELARITKNYSGAEIAGAVRAAASLCLTKPFNNEMIKSGNFELDEKQDHIHISQKDFLKAISEVPPAFGQDTENLDTCMLGGIINYSPQIHKILQTGKDLLKQLRDSSHTLLLSVLLEGPPACGKTALAAKIATDSDFPFVKLVSPEDYVGFSEQVKANRINNIFEDAYKSPYSIVILDQIERLLDYVPIGPRFSNAVLQALLVLLQKQPPQPEKREARKIMVIATCSSPQILDDMQLRTAFNIKIKVPSLTQPSHVQSVFDEMELKVGDSELKEICNSVVPFPIGIKNLLNIIEMARHTHVDNEITAARFKTCVQESGFYDEQSASDEMRDAIEKMRLQADKLTTNDDE